MSTAVAPTWRTSLPSWLTSSPLPYVVSAVVTLLASRLVPYFYRGDFLLKGQPPSIFIVLLLFPLTVILWLLYSGERARGRLLQVFFAGLALSWVLHLMLMAYHGDAYGYSAWLFVPYILMIWAKTPSSGEAWNALVIFAWLLAATLVYAWVGEAVGFQAPYPVPPDLHPWESANYWLPLDGFLGFEGRWPGPFSHNTRAGLAAAFVIVIGASRWSKSTIPLIFVGGFALCFIMVRSAILAVFTALLILLIFSTWGVMKRVPLWARFTGLIVIVAGAAAGLFASGAGLTGRQAVWPAFINLWQSAPILGVGRAGIMDPSNPAAIYEDALNTFIDELARNGLLGFIVQFGTLGLGLAITLVAAGRGFAGPAAILIAYLVASQADIHHDWVHPSFYVLVIVLCVVASAQWIRSHPKKLVTAA